MFLQTNYKKQRFYLLKENLFSSMLRWRFLNFGNLALLKNRKFLFEAGVYEKIHSENQTMYYLKRWRGTQILLGLHKSDDFEAISVTSSIQSIFIIYASLIVISSLWFVVEIVFEGRQKIVFLIILWYYRLKVKMKSLCNPISVEKKSHEIHKMCSRRK